MKGSNQVSDQQVADGRKGTASGSMRSESAAIGDRKKQLSGNNGSELVNSLWSSDGLLSSGRLFQRSSSTPPTQLEEYRPSTMATSSASFGLSRFALRETMEENNQEDKFLDPSRHDRTQAHGKHIQRCWSAPPVPDNADFFSRAAAEPTAHHLSLLDLDGRDTLSNSLDFNGWNSSSGDFDKVNSFEQTSIATLSPIGSPMASETQPESDTSFELTPTGSLQKRMFGQRVTLVDRVQEDFPRTPSPAFGQPAHAEAPLADAMGRLHLEDPRSQTRGGNLNGPPLRHSDRGQMFGHHAHYNPDHRHLQRSFSQPSYPAPPYPVAVPPGFQAPSTRGLYGGYSVNDSRGWVPTEECPAPYPILPVDFNQLTQPRAGPYGMGSSYPPKHGGYMDHPQRGYRPARSHPPVQQAHSSMYDPRANSGYGLQQPEPVYRSKSGPTRRMEFSQMHPVAYTYSSTSLLEEFKAAAKADKWDLHTIKGHLVQFARDQSGSRFIQQRLEKADDQTRDAAFEEIFPQSILLMSDVFGNYVIQKFFDHGSLEQQRRLVDQMKAHMISLARQVYGCRVIQKALEVSQVDQQLLLIRELKGHVLNCVTDQNGNHVLQKCIEAASWKKNGNNPYGVQCHVSADDIQFIVHDFIGQVYKLSTHAYGCRVIQRVLEHCSPKQIRPIVNEVIEKCRDLVKDQYGNYVVQHVIIHGETDQRNIVMEAIIPEIAKWSQHKYASNVVEACLEHATPIEIGHIVDFILQCDESGDSCALLPMMKHMYGNYVVQKLIDKADPHHRQMIAQVVHHNADYLKRFTYGRHVLGRLERDNNAHFY